jgi:hypothetical protein
MTRGTCASSYCIRVGTPDGHLQERGICAIRMFLRFLIAQGSPASLYASIPSFAHSERARRNCLV